MHRRQFLFAFGPLLLASAGLRSQQRPGLQLITPDELEAERKALAQAGLTPDTAFEQYLKQIPRSGPGAPEIRILSPDIVRPVRSPVSIDVAFVPAEGARIDPASLRIRYGFIGLDVTKRIREYADVSEAGIQATVESIPPGKHNFEISIADSLMRVARAQMRCQVLA
jgi:hypothetical protein